MVNILLFFFLLLLVFSFFSIVFANKVVLLTESYISELEKVVFLDEIDFFFLFEIEKAAVTTYVFLFRKF